MSETWIRAAVVLEDRPKEPWHLVFSWLKVENRVEWRTACGLTIRYDVEETKIRDPRDAMCFNCHTISLRDTEPEISSAPLEEDYEPQVMDPSHVSTRVPAAGENLPPGSMETPAIDPDQERAAYVAGWLDGSVAGDEADSTIAVQDYLRWVEAGRP